MNSVACAHGRIACLSSAEEFEEFAPDLERLRAADIRPRWRFWPFPGLHLFFKHEITVTDHTLRIGRGFGSLPTNEQDALLIHASKHLLQYRFEYIEPLRYIYDAPYRLWVEADALKREIAWRIARKEFMRITVSEYAKKLASEWPRKHRLQKLKLSGEWYLFFRDLCDAEFLAGR